MQLGRWRAQNRSGGARRAGSAPRAPAPPQGGTQCGARAVGGGGGARPPSRPRGRPRYDSALATVPTASLVVLPNDRRIQARGIKGDPRRDSMRMIVIFNPGAGTSAGDADATRAQITEAIAAAGAEAEIVSPDEGADLAALAQRYAASEHGTIVAAGGDGTISAVAGELIGSEKTLGVLPVGTLNHFAKDLKIPVDDLAAAARTIAEGNVLEVDTAEVNGRAFINNSSLGIYPRIVAKREAQQERLARGKWPAAVWATVHAFHRYPFMDLQITLDEKQLARRTAFLFIGNNEYEISGFRLGGRKRLDRGRLGLYLTHRTGRIGLFRLALHALFGRVDQAGDFDAFAVEEAIIETRRARVLVATDGEVNWMQSPLHYRIRPRSLRVLVSGETAPS